MAQKAVQVITGMSAQVPGLTQEILFNPELDTSAVLVPGLAVLIIVFVGTLVTSMSVVREREAGTLEQLAVMPSAATSSQEDRSYFSSRPSSTPR
jgi:ABC-2 type transport system permease protein